MLKGMKFEGLIVDPDDYTPLTGVCVIENGVEVHVVNGIIHRNLKEGPAMIDTMGAKHYILDGKTDRIVYPWQTEPEALKVIVRKA